MSAAGASLIVPVAVKARCGHYRRKFTFPAAALALAVHAVTPVGRLFIAFAQALRVFAISRSLW